MGISTTLTIGSTTYDVYGLTADPLADANAYMAGRFGTDAWDNEGSSNNKKKALVSAARWLDRMVWAGTPTDVATPQPLAWPRTGVPACDSIAVVTTEVPDRIVEAEFELALVILGDSEAQDAAGQGSNIKKVKAGSAEVEFHQNTQNSSTDTKLPAQAHQLVSCFFGGNGLGIPHVSGAGKASVFGDDNSSIIGIPGLS